MSRKRNQEARAVDAESRRRRVEAIIAESPLRHPQAKRELAETLVDLRIELESIKARRDAGEAQADEVRVMPGLAQSILKAVDRLGLSAELTIGKSRVNVEDYDEPL